MKGTLFLSQKKLVEEILQKFEMVNCKPISTLMTMPSKLSTNDNPRSIATPIILIPHDLYLGWFSLLQVQQMLDELEHNLFLHYQVLKPSTSMQPLPQKESPLIRTIIEELDIFELKEMKIFCIN